MDSLLVLIALLAYALAVIIEITNRWTKTGESCQKPKLIPAELVLLTIPINIGQAMNPTSAFRFISDTSCRNISVMGLVLVSTIGYILLLSFGKILHSRNRSEAFCKIEKDKQSLKTLYGIAGFFILFSLAMATL